MDSVILNTERNKLLKIKINGKENGICSFYQKIKLYSEKNDIKVTVLIDSNNVRVLDTFVIIPKTYKEPFISFLNPYSQRKYKRKIFIADEGDSSFIKE